jgi:hypothetical protein
MVEILLITGLILYEIEKQNLKLEPDWIELKMVT